MRNLTPRRQRWLRLRIAVLACVLVMGAGRVLFRAYDLQVNRTDTLKGMAEEQYLRDIKLSPKRGSIVDRHGAELAVSVDVDSVWANPRELRASDQSPAVVADKLAHLLGVDRELIDRRLRSNRYFVWIKRRVSPAQGKAVTSLALPGVHISQEARRFYPNRELGAHVLGFANVDGKGIEGLELSLESHLRGAIDQVPAIRDRRGRVVFSQQLLDDRASAGDQVTLTLDKTIQHLAEKELELSIRTFEAKAGSVVAMDPRTGEILAMANYPTFNPNRPGDAPPAHRRNRAVTDRFEPGSTIKPFTVAGALASGAIRSDQLIDCEEGELEVAEYTIHDSHKWEELTPAQILVHSSNIGTAKIGLAMGRAGLYRALRGFGFGAETGLQLPGETGGILRHYKRWYEMDAATISFGQGMSSTAVQLSVAMAALANGGKLMRPILVKRIESARGELVQEALPRVRRQVVPARVARLLSDMLTGVTGEDGTAQEAAIDGYLVAGKTGTAQKADYVRGGYAEDAWSSSFVGFAPAHDPRLVVAVVIDEPVIAHYGGTVAAPVFRRLVEPALRHLGVPAEHEGGSLVTHVRARKRQREALEKAAAELAAAERAAAAQAALDDESAAALDDESGLGHDAHAAGGEGERGGADAAKGKASALPDGRVRVPDMRGMSARAAVTAAQAAELVIELDGSGFVDAQQPERDTVVSPGTDVRVHLSPRPAPRRPPSAVHASAGARKAVAREQVLVAAARGNDG